MLREELFDLAAIGKHDWTVCDLSTETQRRRKTNRAH